jgi:hypothetical protein
LVFQFSVAKIQLQVPDCSLTFLVGFAGLCRGCEGASNKGTTRQCGGGAPISSRGAGDNAIGQQKDQAGTASVSSGMMLLNDYHHMHLSLSILRYVGPSGTTLHWVTTYTTIHCVMEEFANDTYHCTATALSAIQHSLHVFEQYDVGRRSQDSGCCRMLAALTAACLSPACAMHARFGFSVFAAAAVVI